MNIYLIFYLEVAIAVDKKADKEKSKNKSLQKQTEYLRQRQRFIADLVESNRQSTEIRDVETERIRMGTTLQESDAYYQLLIEQIPAATYIAAIDEVGTTLYFSPQIEEMCGFAPMEWSPNSKLWFEQLHPEDRTRVKAELKHSHTTGEPFGRSIGCLPAREKSCGSVMRERWFLMRTANLSSCKALCLISQNGNR